MTKSSGSAHETPKSTESEPQGMSAEHIRRALYPAAANPSEPQSPEFQQYIDDQRASGFTHEQTMGEVMGWEFYGAQREQRMNYEAEARRSRRVGKSSLAAAAREIK